MGSFSKVSLSGAVALGLALGGCATGGGRADASSHPLARKPAPEVSVELEKGGPFRLADAKGKVLMVDFWATWCAPCKASFPRVDALYQKHKAKGLELVAVNEDEEHGKVPEFIAETKVGFPIAFDKEGKAAEVFGVQTMPSSFLIDRRGVVRFVHSGYHPEDAQQIEAELVELLAEAP